MKMKKIKNKNKNKKNKIITYAVVLSYDTESESQLSSIHYSSNSHSLTVNHCYNTTTTSTNASLVLGALPTHIADHRAGSQSFPGRWSHVEGGGECVEGEAKRGGEKPQMTDNLPGLK